MKKLTTKQIVAIVCCAVLALTGIAGIVGSGHNANDAMPRTNGYINMSMSSKKGMQMYADEKSAADVENGYMLTESARSHEEIVSGEKRAIVKNANLSTEVKDSAAFLKEIQEKLEGLSGNVIDSSSYKYGSSKEFTSVNLTVEVPADKLDKFIDYIDANSHVVEKSISQSDITSEYVDTNARLENYIAEEGRLIGLMQKADNLSDLLLIEEKISEVRSQIDYYQSMMKHMQNQVAMSTVCISISEVDREVASGSGFFYEIKVGFIDSLYNIGYGFRDMAVWFITSLPFFAIIAVFAILLVKVVKVIRNKKVKKNGLATETENDRSEKDG